jgi:hypothetical protein
VIASKNDQAWVSKTPEERYTAFLEWIDRELAETAAA